RKVEGMRVFPVVVHDFLQTFNHLVIVNFDGQLSPTVETSRSKVDGPHYGSRAVSEQHLAVQFEVLQLVHLDSNIVHDSSAPDTFNQLVLLQMGGGASHNVNFHTAFFRSHQVLNDDGVLVTFVLHKQAVLCPIDEVRDSLAAASVAPDEVGM